MSNAVRGVRIATLLKSRILREGGWVATGQILSAIAALASIRIITELLSPTEFGRLTLLVGAAALAHGLVSTPRLQAVVRYYPDWRKDGRLDLLRTTAKQLIKSLVIPTAIILSIGGAITSNVFEQAWYAGVLIAALVLVDAGRAFELTFLIAARRQRHAAIIQIGEAWSRPILAIVVVIIAGRTAEAALLGYAVGSALVLLIIYRHVLLEGEVPVTSAQKAYLSDRNTELANNIRRYALPLTPLAVFGWFGGMGDRYVIAAILNLSDVGLYAAAYGVASRPFLMLAAVIEQTARPVVQEAIAQGEAIKTQSTKRQMIVSSVGGSAIGVLCFFALDRLVASILLAEEYRSAAGLMPWIALGYAFLTISTMYTRLCYAYDGTKYVLLLTSIGSIAGIAVLVPAALQYGLMGAVVAVPIRFAIELSLAGMFARMAERSYAEKHVVHRNTG